jgi:hypothetical protein
VLTTAATGSESLRIVLMFVAAQNLTRLIHGSHLVVAEARAAGLTADMLLSRRFHKIFWDAYVARDIAITRC